MIYQSSPNGRRYRRRWDLAGKNSKELPGGSGIGSSIISHPGRPGTRTLPPACQVGSIELAGGSEGAGIVALGKLQSGAKTSSERYPAFGRRFVDDVHILGRPACCRRDDRREPLGLLL